MPILRVVIAVLCLTAACQAEGVDMGLNGKYSPALSTDTSGITDSIYPDKDKDLSGRSGKGKSQQSSDNGTWQPSIYGSRSKSKATLALSPAWDKSILPPVFSQLRMGMSYKEVLSLLPDKSPIDLTTGRLASPEDGPLRNAMISTIIGQAKISAWIIDGKLVKYSVKYFTFSMPKDFHTSLKDELFARLGPSTEVDVSAQKSVHGWKSEKLVYQYSYDATYLRELSFTITNAENFQQSGDLDLTSASDTTAPLLPDIFFQLRVGMSKEEVLRIVPEAAPTKLSSKNTLSSENAFYLVALSETEALIIYFYDEKLDGMLLSYTPPDDEFEPRLLVEVTWRYGAPAVGAPYDRKQDELIWYIGGLEYTYGGSTEKEPQVTFSVKSRRAKYQPLRGSSQTATTPAPKKEGDTFVHPTFWQIRPGMSWADALAMLPGAEAYSSLDGKFPPLSPENPRDDMACKISTNEVVIVSFKNGQIASASLHLYNPDLEYYEALSKELRAKLGRPSERLTDKQGDTATLRWKERFITYECTLDPRGDLIVSAASVAGPSEKPEPRSTQQASTK